MKKTVFLVFILILGISLLVVPNKILSVEEATPSVISREEVKEKIKQRLEDAAEEKIDEVRNTLLSSKAFAYVGLLKSVDDDLLVIETRQGERKAKVASDSAIIFIQPGKSKKNIELEKAEIDHFTIAMGFMNNNEIINARRVVFTPVPTSVATRKVVHGKVTEIDVSRLRIKSNGEELRFSVTSSTDLKIKGLDKPKIADIQIEDKAVAILSLDNEGEVESCKAIFIVPGKYNPEAEENAINATPSVQPSSSDTIEEE